MGLGTFLTHAFNDASQWAGDAGSFGKRVAGDVVGAAEKVPVLGTVVHDSGHVLTDLANWDRDAYTYGISRPLSTFGLVGVNMNNWGDALKGSTWTKSWNESSYTSPGQALTANIDETLGGWTGINNDTKGMNEQQVQDYYQKVFADPNQVASVFEHGSLTAKMLSGGYDMGVSWNTDPSVLVGSAAGAYRKALHSTTDIKTSAQAVAALQKPAVQKVLNATDKMTAYQAKKLPFIAKSANPDMLASVFNQTIDRSIRESAYRYMISNGMDAGAKQELEAVINGGKGNLKPFVKGWGSTADQSAGILESIANAQVVYNPLIQIAHIQAMGNVDRINQVMHSAMDDYQTKLNMPGTQLRMLQDILAMKGHITWQPGRFDVPISAMRAAFKGADKFGDSSKLAQHIPGGATVPGRWVSQVIYKGAYQTPLKVLRAFGDNWPDGWLDFTNNRSSDTLEAFLNRARGMDSATRQGFVNQYLEAGANVAKKQQVAQAAEHAAAMSTLMAKGASQEDAEAILKGTYDKRTQALDSTSQRASRPMEQTFSAATDAEGNPVDLIVHHLDDEDGVPIHVPILETMKRQGTPLLDLDKLDQWAGRNLGKFQTIKKSFGTVTDAVTNSADLFNSIWKNGVLLRFGFTPRVMTDMGLRAVATLGGMRTLGLGAEAAGNVMRNLSIAGYDLTNRILKNRLFDPDTLKDFNDKAGAMTSLRDKARVDYLHAMMQKAADDQAVKAGLPSLVGTPTAEEIKIFKDKYEVADRALTDARMEAELKGGFQKTRFGDGSLRMKGVSLLDLFAGENANYLRQQVSSDRMLGKTLQRNADMEDGVSGSGSWSTIRSDSQNELEAASHLKAWRHSINNQIMQDALGSRVVRNNWHEGDILKWLKTPEGRSYLQNIPGNFMGDLPDYASRVAAHVHYTVPPEVRSFLASGSAQGISTRKLQDLVPVVGDRPDVNGQLLNLNLGKVGGITTALQHFQHAAHKWLGSMPLNTFVYHPTAAGFYRAHLQDAIDKYISFNNLEDASSLNMNHALRQKFEQQAFTQAKNDVWSIMYDLTQQSTAAHQLRFLFPFMNAQQEIIRHWFNIALDHPQILGREQQIWNSPAKAGLVYDTTTGDPATPDTPLENQAIRFQIPHGISRIPGLGVLDDMGQMQISKASINPILQGSHWYVPGAGPMVQVGVQALSKLNPGIMDNNVLKMVMPYGPGDSLAGAILPSFAQRLEAGFSVNNPQYASTFAKVYQAETVRYNEGLRTSAPSVGEIQARTQQLLLLQALGSAVLPFSAKFNPGTQTGVQKPRASVTSGLEQSSVPDLTHTPIQGLIDQYKKLESVDPANAATNFYNKYGQALFALTMSTTKANAAVPATAAGLAAISNPDIRAMIQEDPSIAYAIVGPQAAQGSFDMAAFQAEMNTQIGGGSAQTFRQTLSPADMIKENNAQLGWQQYDQLMSVINAKMSERGITTLNSNSATDLRTIKDQFLNNMNDPNSTDYNPDWYEQYTGAKTDWNARIVSLTNLVSDPNLVNNPARTDLKILGQYLEGRQEINAQLASRPNKEGLPTTLADKRNADLATAWDNYVSGLVMSNTNFALIYQHLLAGDPVNSNLKSNATFQQSLSGIVGQ